MNESIDGITITVYATQDTVEGDSFNNTYDENATYPVVNVTELKEALTNGGIWYTVVAEYFPASKRALSPEWGERSFDV